MASSKHTLSKKLADFDRIESEIAREESGVRSSASGSLSYEHKKKGSVDASNKQALKAFIQLKSSSNIKDILLAFKKYSATQVGSDNWVIALVSLLNDHTTKNNVLVPMIVDNLLPFIITDDLFLPKTALKAMWTHAKKLEKQKTKIAASLTHAQFISLLREHPNVSECEYIRNVAVKLLMSLNLDKEKDYFLKQLGVRQIGLVNHHNSFTAQAIGGKQTFRGTKKSREKIFLKPHSTPINRKTEKSEYKKYTNITFLTDVPIDPSIKLAHKVFHVKSEETNRITVFQEIYQSLILKGYEKIFVILENSKFVTSYFYASAAAKTFEKHVVLVDTRTTGLGFSLFCEALFTDQQLRSDSDVEKAIGQLMQQLHYWTIPMNWSKLSSDYWFRKLTNDHTVLEDTHPYIVLSLSKPSKIIAKAEHINHALDVLIIQIKSCIHRKKINPRAIFIEMRRCPSGVRESLEKRLLDNLPNIPVTIKKYSNGQIDLGDHLGVVFM